jgi:hypothetical protein
MNVDLQTYKLRAHEIRVAAGTTLDRRKVKKYHDEYEIMISYLESTLKDVKRSFVAFCGATTEDPIEAPAGVPASDVEPSVGIIQYNEALNQYSLVIGDGQHKHILRGNRGNIYDHKILYNGRVRAHQVVICKAGSACKNILAGEYCRFYHEPTDLWRLLGEKKISPEFYKKSVALTRNFANTSWLHASDTIGGLLKKNINMRLFGSKQSLKNDVESLRLCRSRYLEDQLKNLEHQIMHDILTLFSVRSIIQGGRELQ